MDEEEQERDEAETTTTVARAAKGATRWIEKVLSTSLNGDARIRMARRKDGENAERMRDARNGGRMAHRPDVLCMDWQDVTGMKRSHGQLRPQNTSASIKNVYIHVSDHTGSG